MAVKIGLIGFGVAGRLLHAPLIKAAGMEITAIATSRASEVAADFPQAQVFPDAVALCASDIDAAVIVSPDHLHVEHAQIALRAGKHVVIDKPIAPTAGEAMALAAEAARRKLMLTVFHNRRWDNDFLTSRKLIAEGALGDVVHYAARWDRYRPNAAGGWRETHMQGELYGLGSHMMDQVLVLFDAPDWISADIYKQREAPGQGDGFEIEMAKGRTRIILGVSLLAADELRVTRVLGTNAAFTKIGLDPQEAQLRAKRPMPVTDPALGMDGADQYGVLTRGDDARTKTHVVSERGDWPAFYRGVRTSIETGTPPPVAANDAARVIAMLEAALESSRTGARVDVPAWLAARNLA